MEKFKECTINSADFHSLAFHPYSGLELLKSKHSLFERANDHEYIIRKIYLNKNEVIAILFDEIKAFKCFTALIELESKNLR